MYGVFGHIANAHHGAVHLFGNMALLLGGHGDLGVAFAHLCHGPGDFSQGHTSFLSLLDTVIGLE